MRRHSAGKGRPALLDYADGKQERRFSYWLAMTTRNWRQLRRLRVELNRQVRRGEIHRRTRDNLLAAERGRLGGRWLERWLGRLLLWSWLLIFLALATVAGIDLGPAWAAAHGHGIPGYFVATGTDTCPRPSTCSWYGNFMSWNGRDVRTHVKLDGAWRGWRAGTEVPALDSGDPLAVFPQRAGSSRWHTDLLAGTIFTVLMLVGPLRIMLAGRRVHPRWLAAARTLANARAR